MGSYWDLNKGYQYVSSSYSLSNTHGVGSGGHSGAELHKNEIEHICNEIVDQKLKQIIPQIYEEVTYKTLNAILEALKVDIHSIVSIGLHNAGDIFYGERAQTALMEAVYNQIVNILETNLNIGIG